MLDARSDRLRAGPAWRRLRQLGSVCFGRYKQRRSVGKFVGKASVFLAFFAETGRGHLRLLGHDQLLIFLLWDAGLVTSDAGGAASGRD
jgi:hypothetical protein